MSYITHSDVAALLQTTLTTTQQNAVTAIIAGVEKAAETYCNRTWSATGEQVETFDGGDHLYFPKKTPITAISSITIDGDTVDPDDVYNYGTGQRRPASGRRRC